MRRWWCFFLILGFTYHFLHHIHNLLLDQIQALGVTSWCTTDDVVDLDVVVFLPNTATVHRIREFDKDGVFLHDTLDVLSADTDDTFVILIRDVKGNGSRHLLLNKIQSVLGGFVLCSAYINVEIVFVESIEDDLNITLRNISDRKLQEMLESHTLAHDLVDLAVLLTANKLFMLICQLDLDTNLVLSPLYEGNLIDNHHGRLDRIVGTIDGKCQLVETHIGSGVRANI